MKYKVTLNKKVYEVEVEKGEATLMSEYAVAAPAAVVSPAPAAAVSAVPAPAVSAAVPAGEGVVTAPLPGSIFDVKVSAGDTVKAGDVLFVIEAMKMENEVLASSGGKVAKVLVSKGSAVETGAPLLVFEGASVPAPVAAAPAAPVVQADPVPAAAVPAVSAVSGEAVNAPLPGSIFDLKVAVGDAVNAGDVLVVIEAMKMENEVVAPKAGKVAQVAVSKGDSVETGTLLLVLA